MKRLHWPGLLPAILILGLLFAGCGDDNGGEPDLIVVSDFEGEWVVLEYKVTSVANPLMSVELISLGSAFEFDAEDDGDFQGRGFVPATLAGTTVEIPFQGTMTLISQDTLSVDFTPEQPPFLTGMRGAFVLDGSTLTLHDPNSDFDFDGDQQSEPADFEATLERQDGSYPYVIFTEDFEGHWEATSYTVTSKANPQLSINTITLGATFEFDVDDEGEALGEAYIPAELAGGQDTTFTDFPASFELIYQDTMMIAFNPQQPPFLTNTRGHFTLDGDVYTLTDTNAFFVFDQAPEPAIAVVVLERSVITK